MTLIIITFNNFFLKFSCAARNSSCEVYVKKWHYYLSQRKKERHYNNGVWKLSRLPLSKKVYKQQKKKIKGRGFAKKIKKKDILRAKRHPLISNYMFVV